MPRNLSKRKWLLLLIAVVVMVVWFLHATMLRSLAGLLIVDQPTDDFNCIGIMAWGQGSDGDRCYDVAGDLHRQNPARRILLIAPSLNRIEQIGAMPSFAAVGRKELTARRVPDEAISLVPGERHDYRTNARALAAWLPDHPGNTVLLLCEQFRSAQLRHTLDAVLDPADAARVFVRALPDREFDDADWWTCRSGYRMFGSSWLMRFQDWIDADSATPSPEQTADDYQRDFLKTLAERTP